jgi:hypothetical protein
LESIEDSSGYGEGGCEGVEEDAMGEKGISEGLESWTERIGHKEG